jgi:hypothetical protein
MAENDLRSPCQSASQCTPRTGSVSGKEMKRWSSPSNGAMTRWQFMEEPAAFDDEE